MFLCPATHFSPQEVVRPSLLPPQAIVISPGDNSRKAILSGSLRTAVIDGQWDYQCGETFLCNHSDPWCVKANITTVEHMRLQDIPERELRAIGCADVNDAVIVLRREYPAVSPDSVVTLIKWDNVQGSLVP